MTRKRWYCHRLVQTGKSNHRLLTKHDHQSVEAKIRAILIFDSMLRTRAVWWEVLGGCSVYVNWSLNCMTSRSYQKLEEPSELISDDLTRICPKNLQSLSFNLCTRSSLKWTEAVSEQDLHGYFAHKQLPPHRTLQ